MNDDAARILREALKIDPEEASALISEAREEARSWVRMLLVQEFSDQLLHEVRDQLRHQAPPAAAPSAPPAASAPEHHELGWYVYCVVAADKRDVARDVPGILDGEPAFTVVDDQLAAVVSRVDLAEFDEEPLRERLADMQWLERTARAHEHVLDTVGRAATLVPMRLCTIYREADGVREMLTREASALEHALAHLEGKREWGIKVFAELDAAGARAAQPSRSASPETQEAGDGAAYMQARLGARRAREDARRQLEEACQAIHDALSATAEQAVSNPVQRPEVSAHHAPMILNASYLVRDDRFVAFEAERDRLLADYEELDIEIQLTGPWPPYNFVPGAIGAAW